jgi:hypothetical protein
MAKFILQVAKNAGAGKPTNYFRIETDLGFVGRFKSGKINQFITVTADIPSNAQWIQITNEDGSALAVLYPMTLDGKPFDISDLIETSTYFQNYNWYWSFDMVKLSLVPVSPPPPNPPTGAYDKFLNIAPCNCRYCSGASQAIIRLTNEAELDGIDAIELRCTNAERIPIWNALMSENPLFVNGFGHGSETTYTGDSETMIFDVNNCTILKGRIVYLLSCLTANLLGPKIIEIGAVAYGGFNISWGWYVADITQDPYNDYLAESFYRSSNEFPIALLQGETVGRAQERSIAEYNRWINIWETKRGNDQYAASVISQLLADRDGLVVLGDKTARITRRNRTTMLVDIVPPATTKLGVPFGFSGRVLVGDTGAPMSGITVNLIVDDTVVSSTVTDANGAWAFSISLIAIGRHSIVASSLPDANYLGGHSDIYSVGAGITNSSMVVTLEPPNYIPTPNYYFISGKLVDANGTGIPNASVMLALDDVVGTPLQRQYGVTDANGNWSFAQYIPGVGYFVTYVVYAGSNVVDGCSTYQYPIRGGSLLAITATAGGTTNPVPGTYGPWLITNTKTVSQKSARGYRFNHWELDGVVYTSSRITVTMDRDHNLLAVFI